LTDGYDFPYIDIVVDVLPCDGIGDNLALGGVGVLRDERQQVVDFDDDGVADRRAKLSHPVGQDGVDEQGDIGEAESVDGCSVASRGRVPGHVIGKTIRRIL